MIWTLHGPLRNMTRMEYVALVTALALAAALTWPVRGYLTDDTFIHLQYARQLATGHGLVFNAGERVYGCTSPLWVALIAAGMALGLDGIVVARVLGLAATLTSVVLMLKLMRRSLRTPALAAAATIAWAAHAWMLRWSLSGMETALAVALTLAGFVAFTEGKQWGARPVRSGTWWAFAALARPEAALLLLLWGICLLADTENRPGIRRLLYGAAPPILIYGAWLVFARLYFGTWLPQTLAAKAAGSGGGLGDRLEQLWREAKIVGATDGWLVALLVAALLFGGRRMWPRQVRAQRLLPWIWVVAVPLLYVGRGVPVLSRYLLPLLPILALLAWRAAEEWWLGPREPDDRGEVRAPLPPAPAIARRVATLGACVALVGLVQNLVVYRVSVVPQVRSFTAGISRTLVPWGRWLGAHAPAGTLIATPDIGAIGYYSRLPVLDLGGLVTPPMVPLLERAPFEDVSANLGFAVFARPRYLVDRAPAPRDLMARSRFAPALTPLMVATVPNLGIARPGEVAYTLYEVNWTRADSIATGR